MTRQEKSTLRLCQLREPRDARRLLTKLVGEITAGPERLSGVAGARGGAAEPSRTQTLLSASRKTFAHIGKTPHTHRASRLSPRKAARPRYGAVRHGSSSSCGAPKASSGGSVPDVPAHTAPRGAGIRRSRTGAPRAARGVRRCAASRTAPCYATACCAVPCCAIARRAVPCYNMPYCAAPQCHATPYYPTLYCTLRTGPHHPAPNRALPPDCRVRLRRPRARSSVRRGCSSLHKGL